MKNNYKKTFLGSILAFAMGLSCCWMSALAIWIGGVTLFGSIASFLEILRPVLIGLGIFMGIVSLVLFLKKEVV